MLNCIIRPAYLHFASFTVESKCIQLIIIFQIKWFFKRGFITCFRTPSHTWFDAMFTMDQPLISQSGKSAPDKIVVSLNESATQPKKQYSGPLSNSTINRTTSLQLYAMEEVISSESSYPMLIAASLPPSSGALRRLPMVHIIMWWYAKRTITMKKK